MAKDRTTTRGRVTPRASARYTPPVPREQRVSPIWVPVLIAALLALGSVIIILNYVEVLPGAATNWYLLGGLGLITAAFLVATKWH